MMTIMESALKKDNYYFDYNTNTLYVTKAFDRKASQYNSAECNTIMSLRQMFPNLTVQIAEAPKSSKKNTNKSNSKETNKLLPYDLMLKYIVRMPNALDLLKEYENVRLMSKCQKSPYKYVCKWFEAKFPNYGKMLTFDEEGNLVWKKEEEDSAKSEEKVVELPKASGL